MLIMNQDKYNIEWNSYSDHLKEMLHDMLKSNYLTDVTLVCDDKRQFKAHKIVLSACSSVFKDIINNLPETCSVIYLRGIQHQEMDSILEFMYLGVATFYQERLNEFLSASRSLEIKKLSQDVEMKENYTVNNEMIEIKMKPTNDSDIIDTDAEVDDLDRQKLMQVQAKHVGLKYACHTCEYVNEYQHNLRSHIQSKHEGVRYDCKQCKYQASKQWNLKMHIQLQQKVI